MRVVFDPRALVDLDEIHAFISEENPNAASALIARIFSRVKRLETPGFEYMGRRGDVESTRELVEPPYIIVYRIDVESQQIIVLAIVHAARDR